MKVNLGLLLDAKKKARRVKEIPISLFPDVVYTGVIEKIEFDGAGYSWIGHLKGVEYSSMFMVYTAGVFIGHFASPKGVYEVSVVGEGDLYRVVLINQQRLEGGNDLEISISQARGFDLSISIFSIPTYPPKRR